MHDKWKNGKGNSNGPGPGNNGPFGPFDHLTKIYEKYAAKVGLKLLHQETVYKTTMVYLTQPDGTLLVCEEWLGIELSESILKNIKVELTRIYLSMIRFQQRWN